MLSLWQLRYFMKTRNDLGIRINGKDLKTVVTDAALCLLTASPVISDVHVLSITRGMQSIALLHQVSSDM